MLPPLHDREDRDEDHDTRDVLYGLAAALPSSLLLCGIINLAMAMLR
jgi:hypothetical protein